MVPRVSAWTQARSGFRMQLNMLLQLFTGFNVCTGEDSQVPRESGETPAESATHGEGTKAGDEAGFFNFRVQHV